eukprot:snap_masked-scaffold_2-processed-gene-5.29-mRNA-1 protein AED:1.00 eAED:1.00 QI:0/-1/0/0/-1/1/1/0/64
MYLCSLAKVKVVEGEKESKTIKILKEVMQGDSLSPTHFILTVDRIIHRLKDNTCEKVKLVTEQA